MSGIEQIQIDWYIHDCTNREVEYQKVYVTELLRLLH